MPRVLLVCFAVLAMVACTEPSDPAHDLEDRLFAPCCWRQSLRDHESPIATQLRAEIEHRVAAGEPPAAIEADLVRRYGEGIRALPSHRDPRSVILLVVGAAIVSGLALLVVVLRRRPARAGPVAAALHPEDPDEAERLDDELARLD